MAHIRKHFMIDGFASDMFELFDLRPDTFYTFRVSAVNQKGASKPFDLRYRMPPDETGAEHSLNVLLP